MDSLKEAFNHKNVEGGVMYDAQRRSTGSHVCSFARNAVQLAAVCLLALTVISRLALATIIGRLNEEDQNAPELLFSFPFPLFISSALSVYLGEAYDCSFCTSNRRFYLFAMSSYCMHVFPQK